MAMLSYYQKTFPDLPWSLPDRLAPEDSLGFENFITDAELDKNIMYLNNDSEMHLNNIFRQENVLN